MYRLCSSNDFRVSCSCTTLPASRSRALRWISSLIELSRGRTTRRARAPLAVQSSMRWLPRGSRCVPATAPLFAQRLHNRRALGRNDGSPAPLACPTHAHWPDGVRACFVSALCRRVYPIPAHFLTKLEIPPWACSGLGTLSGPGGTKRQHALVAGVTSVSTAWNTDFITMKLT